MSAYDADSNDEQLALNLIDELRDQAKMRNFAYKQCVAKYYDSRVKPRAFKLGDWVMRKTLLATKNSAKGTLEPTWEGHYEVIKVCCPVTYQLRDCNGKPLPYPWNANHLKYYRQINMSRSLPLAPIFSHYSYAFGTYVLCFTKLPMYVYLSAPT
ncbi:hypothetical protein L3X38_002481 [Prunus dulcis]|uniref:Uncharacterized protein n=1 Tax=Prunus dulcis TaxID=3755 RepID=A0AAD4WU41_PRUDU|nr:hypothetical protein L3X38_002481 [Prunus dulcis]